MAAKNMPYRKHARRLGALKRFKMKPSRKGVQTLEQKQIELDHLTVLVGKGA